MQKLANGMLGVMSYTVVPDVTTSSLAINNAAASSTDLTMTQLGGGFTCMANGRPVKSDRPIANCDGGQRIMNPDGSP